MAGRKDGENWLSKDIREFQEGLEPEPPTQNTADGLLSTADKFWIADYGNRPCVFAGDHNPGGTCSLIRWATVQDLATLSRR